MLEFFSIPGKCTSLNFYSGKALIFYLMRGRLSSYLMLGLLFWSFSRHSLIKACSYFE